ncbi:TetR/AcrR family transcriptional regulator [Agromyces protaetiae]|uniref:TetR/AcrR family transcriptional regulator n=1 Tax=Agromyces protaetiae TaxID=2509455 RepID=A0A4P6FC36_9MICO|nr:TetR/AcrR family transcriptional regulator [Agromyces protaetiae]QAY72493.1 TetR/AcrR family transcriptional regulator [Agromyces protaetiae]
MSGEFQRARSREAKQQREQAILDAAERLAAREGTRLTTLTGIADEIGMHKSALLRYFETREQIFLRLTVAGWQEWSAVVVAQLDGSEHPSPEVVATTLVATLVARPLFCDLLAEAPLNLERNVSVEGFRDFKLPVLAEVERITQAIGRATGLDHADADTVLSAAVTLTAGVWQMANPTAEVAALYRSDPRLAHAVIDVESHVTRMVAAMIRGLPLG